METPTRFAILSDARSGTSLLTATLNSHPDVICHGEIFHQAPKDYHIKVPREEVDPEEVLSLRENDTQRFVELVYNRPSTKAVGFKMWRSQNPRYCDELLEDESVAKIIYERSNVLAKYSSSQLAKQTGIWNLNSGAERPDMLDKKLTFNPEQFQNYVKRHKGMFNFYRANSKGRTLDISYLDVVNRGFSEVLDFIGVSPVALKPKKEKLHTSTILDRFEESEHDIIIKSLDEIGHSEWLHE
ncbi:hypothetical protein SAMN05421641_11741 [Paracoccus thiocyanatus]|uniref:LPS sulfotransferase NodH n=1 Tax=Paracoccus thiocyanatus TaxID=34006 RepID=A0A1N6WL78_9RHOB|nr:hypothetical protein [Paracoccus thiocyanatus]SIQ90831.1 hypothetical protein SAMN05421641_11741 [Paracoccus thiocyanatus]